MELSDHVGILGGVGILTAETPWAYGIRVYLQKPGRRWRLHGSVFRWLQGSGVYFGVDHDVGRSSGVVLTYGLGVGDVNLEAPVGLTIGVGYRF